MSPAIVCVTRALNIGYLQAAGSPSYRGWPYHHRRGHGHERDDRSASARRVSRAQPLVLRFLVQLLQCHQPRRPFHVLVRNSVIHGLGVRLPGPSVLSYCGPLNSCVFCVDAKSYLAEYSKHAQPYPCQFKHHDLR